MSYYIYENWRVGLHNAKWSDPFNDLKAARQRQTTTHAKEKRNAEKTECGLCLRRRPLL